MDYYDEQKRVTNIEVINISNAVSDQDYCDSEK